MRVRVTAVAVFGLVAVGCSPERKPETPPAKDAPVAPVVPATSSPSNPERIPVPPREVTSTPPKPTPPPPSPEEQAFVEAADALRREDHPRAIAKFTEVIARGHRLADAHFQRGL